MHTRLAYDFVRRFDNTLSDSRVPYIKDLALKSVSRPYLCACALAVFVAGCGGEPNPGTIPASSDAGSTHDAIENPAGVKEKASTKKKAANELPPQPPK